mmetsp:Transcript_18645/g.28935  ORF Transcript_18645/g.28935 Transcript_18645/m.28935 type:complete len:657 (+) Transcript_18645:896-2866(+)|eukprot:CAMPEP_0196825568 /NCGR_PEP_ID=MMETSP1362-20130617/93130_1 /TAXON_ID=163516 /ORGANISM="Leptocylindrus danicus, Strain CCMP1856" /LENGTH=656 /DNA_ID=CAMNT_0042206017 /DNA_START=965 /DNA_END=2935 /DNA_ORIENTATION=+
MSAWNRKDPLFQQHDIPVEVVLHDNTNNSSTRRQKFTLRILNGSKGGERTLRFELSNEYNFISNLSVYDGGNSSCSSQTVSAVDCVAKETLGIEAVQLYELEVNEHDFAVIRRSQALLVDFPNFADSVISLLNSCDFSNGSQRLQDMGSPFNHQGTVLTTGGSQFNSTCTPRSISEMKSNLNSSGSTVHSTPVNGPLHSNCHAPYACRLELFPSEKNCAMRSKHSNNCIKNSQISSQARFSIVESNRFRELTHIYLDLEPGCGESIESYLSARLVQMLQGNNSLLAKLDRETERADLAEKSCRAATEELNQLSISTEAEKRELRLQAGEHAQHTERQRNEEFKKLLNEKEEAFRMLHDKMDTTVREMQAKIDSYEEGNRKLLKEKFAAETKCEQLQCSLKSHEKQLETLVENNESCHEKLRVAEDEKRQVEQKLHQSELQVIALEKTNESQEDVVKKADALRTAAELAVTQEKESLKMYKVQLEQIRSQFAASVSEINRGNEIIAKIQKDKKEVKRNLKSKIEMIRRQEEVVAKTENELVETKQSLFDARSEVDRLRNSNESRDRQLKDAHSKLAESAKLLESNQQVIAWLNREINEVQLGKSGGGGINSISAYGTTSTRPGNSYPEATSQYQTSFQPSMMFTPAPNPSVNKNTIT